MKKYLLIASALFLGCFAASAQYMPSEKGTVLTYKSSDVESNKEDTYHARVTDVVTADNGVVTATVVETHKVEGTAFGELDQTTTFSYDPATEVTTNTLLTADEFKRVTLLSIREMLSQSGQFVSDQQMAELENSFKPKGDMEVPIPAKVADEEAFANSAIRASFMGMSVGVKIVKGKYLGYEEIEVPAGKFNCVKLTYTLAYIGQGAEPDKKITSWYAPGVGLVKQVAANKKDKPVGEDVLISIEK